MRVSRRSLLAAAALAPIAAACDTGDKPPPDPDDTPAVPPTTFGSPITVGRVDQIQPGQFIRDLDARCWVMRYDDTQAEREGVPPGSLLALHHKCPHLGCTVPYRPEFPFVDPRSDIRYTGWFRCPCHGGTFSLTGVSIFGPQPRGMDTFALYVRNGEIIVDTGHIAAGGDDNPSRVIVP